MNRTDGTTPAVRPPIFGLTTAMIRLRTALRDDPSAWRRRWIRAAAVVALGAALLVDARPGAAQEPTAPDEIASTPSGFSIFGRAPAQRFGAGSMVLTVHPFIDTSKYPRVTDNLDGLYARFSQFFVARYINSYGDESWVVAMERHWGSASLALFDVGLGYRVGIVTGYDERLMSLARHTPVLPIGGIIGWIHLGPAGTTVFWAYRAISIELSLRCC